MTEPPHDVVFLVDVDNTLLDNDAIVADLRAHLVAEFGGETAAEYWTIFETLRDEVGYADYLGALQRYRAVVQDRGIEATQMLLQTSAFLIDYPFPERVFPRAFEALAALARHGPTVILSDGDVVFQPRKVRQAGLWEAVGSRVLIYVHKELELDEVARHWPARRYVMIDDKPRILRAFKAAWGDRVTTVFPRQGHYAFEAAEVARAPQPDITIERIGDLADADLTAWLA